MTQSAPRIERLAEIDSTNEEAKRRLGEGAETPFWISAAAQTAGRGRRGRPWQSSGGNLFLSGAYRFSSDPGELAQLSFVTALAAYDAFAAHVLPGAVSLKLPNDLLLDGAKAGGILLESGTDSVGRWLVVGIGLNIADAPDNTPYPALALADRLAPGLNRPHPDDVARDLAAAFESWLGVWRREGFTAIRKAWLSRASGLGEPIVVKGGAEDLYGVFEDLDAGGALCLRQPDGALMRVAAGDVFFPGRK